MEAAVLIQPAIAIWHRHSGLPSAALRRQDCPARFRIAGIAAPGVDHTPLLYRMTSAWDAGITSARHLIINLCAEASA
jgi:hypothetical protein